MSNPNLVIERIRQNKETGKLWDFRAVFTRWKINPNQTASQFAP